MSLLELNDFEKLRSENCMVIDTRPSEIFSEGFIKESVSVPLNESFIDTLNDFFQEEQPLLFLAEEKSEEELIKKLLEAGRSGTKGILKGGFYLWKNSGKKTDMLILIDADEFAMDYQYDEFFLLDVRNKEAFNEEHAEDAENILLAEIENALIEMDESALYYIYGDGISKSITAASFLKQSGFERVRVLNGSFGDLKKTNIPLIKKKKEEKPFNKN